MMNGRFLARILLLPLFIVSCRVLSTDEASVEENKVTNDPTSFATPNKNIEPQKSSELLLPQLDNERSTITPDLSATQIAEKDWYVVQPGTPFATKNISQADIECSWLGVGGQVFGRDLSPVLGINVIVGGALEGVHVGSFTTTGMETNIGEGGYEITLADHPVDSDHALWIRIVDSIGHPLSDKVYFDTINDCNRNFVIINFIHHSNQTDAINNFHVFLPLVIKNAQY